MLLWLDLNSKLKWKALKSGKKCTPSGGHSVSRCRHGNGGDSELAYGGFYFVFLSSQTCKFENTVGASALCVGRFTMRGLENFFSANIWLWWTPGEIKEASAAVVHSKRKEFLGYLAGNYAGNYQLKLKLQSMLFAKRLNWIMGPFHAFLYCIILKTFCSNCVARCDKECCENWKTWN